MRYRLMIGLAVLLLGGGVFLKINKPSAGDNSGANPLQAFLEKNRANSEISEAYRFALENPQGVLSKVKCYCGCLKNDHQNNRDCFINPDQTFDLMGLNCGLCVKTALLAKQMLAEGYSVDKIASYVDDRWGN